MPFFPCISVDGCLRLFEPEIRYSLCPRRNARKLRDDMTSLMGRRLGTEATIRRLVESGNVQARVEVELWLSRVDSLGKEVNELLESLDAGRCWRLFSNHTNGLRVEELQTSVSDRIIERDKWVSDDELVVRRESEAADEPENGTPRNPEDPWSIFCSYMLDGGAAFADGSSTTRHARDIVEILQECCSSDEEQLHFALRSVAGAMKEHSAGCFWDDAATKLRRIAAEHRSNAPCPTPVIESILRFCYDSLESDLLRTCLSSCAVFYHSAAIQEDDLIAVWMSQGLLDDGSSIAAAYSNGLGVIRRLKSSHLLETSNWSDFYLRINERVQYVAKSAAGGALIRSSGVKGDLQSWVTASSVSIRDLDSVSLPDNPEVFEDARLPENTPTCRDLTVLLAAYNKKLTRIHHDLFRFTPGLVALDLSRSKIAEVPTSIRFLKALRFLNLRETKIRSLPIEIAELEALRQLNLAETRELKSIIRECISRLSQLQLLYLNDTGHSWDSPKSYELHLEDLQRATNLQQLLLTVTTVAALREINARLAKVVFGLILNGEEFAPGDLHGAFSAARGLQLLEIKRCPRLDNLAIAVEHLRNLQELKLAELPISTFLPEETSHSAGKFLPSLRFLGIHKCDSLKNLTWVGRIASLELMCLAQCGAMTKLVERDGTVECTLGEDGVDDDGVTFPNLQFLVLWGLPSLRSFSWRHPLRLPALRTLRVRDCPSLRKLPFGSSSCKAIREIKGSRDWWNKLEWDDMAVQSRFQPYFRAY